MTTRAARLERASRALEWCEAYKVAERTLQWALATSKITEDDVPAIVSELRAVAPFATYVSGRWTPPLGAVEDVPAAEALLREVEQWEQSQEGASA